MSIIVNIDAYFVRSGEEDEDPDQSWLNSLSVTTATDKPCPIIGCYETRLECL